MRIEHWRATKVIVLTGPNGEQIRITKFLKSMGDSKNLAGEIGIDLPREWRISYEERVPSEPR